MTAGGFSAVPRDSLADTLARRIRGLIQSGEYTEGDRLPAILEMARRFGVGPPTVREALKKLETLVPCTMCGAHGELPESPEQAEERGAKWYEWMDPETREDRTCNSCQGTKKERQLGTYEGWYSWRLENWGTKWDASFDGPFMALMTHDDADLDVSVETQGATVTPTVAVYKFDTAWGPPVPFVGGASERFKELEFVLRFGEPGNGFAGEVKYVAGVCMHDEELEVEEVLAPEEMWF